MTKIEIARAKTSIRRVFERLGKAKINANDAQKQSIEVARKALIEAFDALTSLWHSTFM